MKLYEIEAEIQELDKKLMEWAEDHEGDYTDFPLREKLDSLGMDKEKKALAVAIYIKNNLAEAEMIKKERGTLGLRQASLAKRAESFKYYLQLFVPVGTEYENAKAQIKWRKGSKLVIPGTVSFEDVDEQYIKVERDFKKAEIKKAVKNGDIDWARIDDSKNIQIK